LNSLCSGWNPIDRRYGECNKINWLSFSELLRCFFLFYLSLLSLWVVWVLRKVCPAIDAVRVCFCLFKLKKVSGVCVMIGGICKRDDCRLPLANAGAGFV